MKNYDAIRVKQDVAVVGSQFTNHFSTTGGFTISSDGPTVLIAKGEDSAEVPWSNVVFAKPKKAAKK